jgi:hypothetical protein
MLGCYSAAARADIAVGAHPSASLTGLLFEAKARPHQGSVVNRAEGWVATLNVLDMAFNHDEQAREWLVSFADLLTFCQLPSGGFIAWDANKEATAYAFEESGGKQLAVSQGYQEAILEWPYYLCTLNGIGSRDVLIEHVDSMFTVYRAPGSNEPPYRVAVFPKGRPDQCVRTWDEMKALYVSKETSGYHYTIVLAIGVKLEVPSVNEALASWAFGGDPVAKMLGESKFWGNRAPLAGELMSR